MLAVLRILIALIISVIICTFGVFYCLFNNPRNPLHVSFFARLFGRMAPIFGIQVEVRQSLMSKMPKNCMYISNHQNNYDMITASCVVQPRTVTVGKKSLLWVPLFGALYWLSGNFFINRRDSISAHRTLIKIIQNIKERNISIWIFPEGTRSRGKGLLPFKKGAFYAAIVSGVPIVPICVSNISDGKIKLNRWSNGLVIVEILSPIETKSYSERDAGKISDYCYNLMRKKIDKLNQEVMIRESSDKT